MAIFLIEEARTVPSLAEGVDWVFSYGKILIAHVGMSSGLASGLQNVPVFLYVESLFYTM